VLDWVLRIFFNEVIRHFNEDIFYYFSIFDRVSFNVPWTIMKEIGSISFLTLKTQNRFLSFFVILFTELKQSVNYYIVRQKIIANLGNIYHSKETIFKLNILYKVWL
jgi:hypothetical protein